MAILFLVTKVADPEDWVARLQAALPDETIRLHPDLGDPAGIDCAVVATPPPGVLGTLPRLQLICSLWAGVDALAADPTFPRHVKLTRLVDPYMTDAMTETVVTHVMAAHRQIAEYRRQQAAGAWRALSQPRAAERRVGILGLGALGQDAAAKLIALGFDVAGWSRRPRDVPGVACFAGPDGLAALLARTDILVCLLPLTDETRGILDARLFDRLPAGATLINVARGAHLVEADLLAALDTGRLREAVLDVFATEPLPAGHPFWSHPRILATPHVAAISDPRSAVDQIADNVRRFRAGRPLLSQVDWAAGY